MFLDLIERKSAGDYNCESWNFPGGDIWCFVIYVVSGPSLLKESTDSMILSYPQLELSL